MAQAVTELAMAGPVSENTGVRIVHSEPGPGSCVEMPTTVRVEGQRRHTGRQVSHTFSLIIPKNLHQTKKETIPVMFHVNVCCHYVVGKIWHPLSFGMPERTGSQF